LDNFQEVFLKKDKRYSFCSCGQSKVLPFCDGSHKDYNNKMNMNYKSIKIITPKDIKVKVYSSSWRK
tara:strand:- start:64 stop:264 length:201 start_codon:yes stop_codon:yes gene_type:complete